MGERVDYQSDECLFRLNNMRKNVTQKVLNVVRSAGRGVKRIASDPRVYADVALCAVMVVVIAAAAGKSLPQLGQEALAAIASITGEGTQNALAAFTGTNTIGNATISQPAEVYVTGITSTPTVRSLGVHFGCFLTKVAMHAMDTGSNGNYCVIEGSPGNNWTLSANASSPSGTDQHAWTSCRAFCIN